MSWFGLRCVRDAVRFRLARHTVLERHTAFNGNLTLDVGNTLTLATQAEYTSQNWSKHHAVYMRFELQLYAHTPSVIYC